MHKSATKCNNTIGKWCKNKHGASKIIDTFETYQVAWGLGIRTSRDMRFSTYDLLSICLIRLKCIYNFWCSILVFTPFASCFVYTLWRFYAIFGTNLLTRCHSASFLFSAIFVFQKSYTGNILRIGRNKFGNSYFYQTEDEDQTGAEEGPEAGHTTGGRGPAPGRAHPWWARLGHLLTTPLRL
jgi:hypothetical protein